MATAAVRQFKQGKIQPLIEKYRVIKSARPEKYGGSYFKNACAEIPEVLFMSIYAVIGAGFVVRGYFKEKNELYYTNKPFKRYYTVFRPDDPRVERIHTEYYGK